jgi:hypothetical protein
MVIPDWKLLRSLGGPGLSNGRCGQYSDSHVWQLGYSPCGTGNQNSSAIAVLCRRQHRGFSGRGLPDLSNFSQGGEQWLEKRIGAKRSRRIQNLIKRRAIRGCIRVVYCALAVSHLAVLRRRGGASLSPRKTSISRHCRLGSPLYSNRLSCREVHPNNTALSEACARTRTNP